MLREVITDIFGAYVPPPPVGVAKPRPSTAHRPPRPPLDLHLETAVVSGGTGLRRRRCVTWPCSLILHAAGALAMVALPLLLTASLPEAGNQVHAFFVEPMLAPPPPPPPPPPAASRSASARVEPQPSPESSGRFTAPVSVPDELRLEEGLDLGFGGGVPGGVAGGVPGGVVGGVVGGLPESISAPPPPVTPLRVGGQVKEPVKVKHVDPVYPRLAADASIQGVVVIEAVIDSTGQVTQAVVLSGVPLLNEAALDAVRRWQYSPTLVNGIPTPIVLVITVTFQLKLATAI